MQLPGEVSDARGIGHHAGLDPTREGGDTAR
jgi:hypothetical protein